jgi:hypothetical protein
MDSRRTFLTALTALPFASSVVAAQTSVPPQPRVLPRLGITAKFLDRNAMRMGHPTLRFSLTGEFPKATLPIDWTKGNRLSFPLDGNGYDQFGDCMYAAACHADNTFTGNTGVESSFDPVNIIKGFLDAGGSPDNGLNEGQIISAWRSGLAGQPDAGIIATSGIDPTDATAVQTAIYLFGGVFFMLNVPDTWLSLATGGTWDVPATADSNNGHAVWWNGVDTDGNYKLQTWGTYGWITPAAVKVCDPSAFVVFSLRWFNSEGVAPNGLTFTQLAALWQQFGGGPLNTTYQTRFIDTVTSFANESAGVWLMTDYDRDGIPDLAYVKTKTQTGKVEVHIASGASKYQTRILETPTTFANESDGVWLMADYDRDGIPDLVFIKTSGTQSGNVEVHIASGASNYQKRILETTTAFSCESDGVWLMADYDRDGIPDLVFIKTSGTQSGQVEVHIASGASKFQTRILEVPTTFDEENDGVWTMVNYNGKGTPDLVFIKTANTSTGDVEIHIASGASKYQTRILETPTVYATERDGSWLMATQKGIEKPLLGFIKTANTSSGYVEVHLARA